MSSLVQDVDENSILARYHIETSLDLKEVAETLAVGETTGEWIFKNSSPSRLFARCRGRVHKVNEKEKGKGTISLLFPLINMNLKKAAFADTWLTMIGGATFDMIAYTKSRLADFSVPEKVLEYFPGPKFGMDGTREYLGLKKREPVVGTIMKPTSGLSAKEVAKICYESALGGVRFIKDDEKMLSPSYCPLAQRVKLVSEALRKAEKETGQKVLYAPHISAGPDQIMKNAKTALRNGANALMLNFFGSGFGSLEMLAKDKNINVPIYSHCGGRSAFARVPGQGIDPVVIAKFARLCGGDYFRSGVLGGYLVGDNDELLRITNVLREEVPGIKDTAVVLSGGLNAENVVDNIKFFGRDVLVLAGSGLLSHPSGIKVGAEIFSKAVKDYMATLK